MNVIDKLLRPYEKSSFVIKYKARFLLYLTCAILLFMPVVIIYTIFIQLHDPELNYSINWPVVSMEIIGYAIIIGITIFLLRGYFFLSAHLMISVILITVWAVMFRDHSNIISRLDTIVIVIGILMAMPIFITRKKFMVFVYVGVNICVLFIFMFHTRGIFQFPGGSFPDFLADTTIAFLFIAITSYNILSINNRALDRYESSNSALQKSNEELQAATEELTAANEEFEAQNEELIRSEEALRLSEAELLSIFNGTHDAMIIFDFEGRILDVNDRMTEMYGLDRATALTLNIRKLSAPVTDLEGLRKILSGEKTLYEWKARRINDNTVFDVEVGMRHLRRRGAEVILAAVRDVSDRKKAESALRESLEEKIILIKEIHHRVKNNMQVISSLLNMQADSVDEPRANQALRDAIGRIHSMASIHEKIYSTDNFTRVDMAAYVNELSKDLLALHSGRRGPVTIESRLHPVFMKMDKAIPFGLIINEILTNSIKHGCGESTPCAVDLLLEESAGWITLTIADNGPGMEPEIFSSEQKTSMGMQIIEALAKQINATLSLDVDRGTRFIIRVRSDS